MTLLVLLSLLLGPAAAQNFEIQVYPSATAGRGTTFVEVHSNTATKGAYHETLEVTRGFSDWFETGFYVFSSARSGEGWDFAGAHVRPRVQAPLSWGLPFGASLSAEVGWFDSRFADSRWDMELRPILDRRWGSLYVSVNPALERGLKPYPGGSARFVFAPAAKVSCDALRFLALGVEYYGSLADEGHEHQVFAIADLINSPDWELNAGPGFGFTRYTDDLLLKLIVGRRFR